MKFKPESVTWRVDREYSRWFSIETHSDTGCRKHKVLVTAWREKNVPKGCKWRSKIIVPMNVGLSQMLFAGRDRKTATNAALHHFQIHLRNLGEWS